MRRKQIARLGLDLAMTVLLLLLMTRQITGEDAHEWLGAAMFVLWLLHHLLNRRWYGSLFKGKHGPARLLQTTVDILLLAAMAGLIISGVMLSRTEFAFFETGQPLVLFFAQYIAMLGMWICAGHHMMKLLRRR